MKGLSLWPEPATQILYGDKEIEFRSWNTKHRGPLVICTAQKPVVPFSMPGYAIAIVDVVDVKKAGPGEYGWILDNLRFIKPFPVKGKQGFINIDDSLIEYMPEFETREESNQWILENAFPHMAMVEMKKDGWYGPTKEACKKFGYEYYE